MNGEAVARFVFLDPSLIDRRATKTGDQSFLLAIFISREELYWKSLNKRIL
jgi:hypothetical protein